MKTRPENYNTRRIAQDILAYLLEHPQASDTLEGILEWWLLEQRISFEMQRVRDALTGLVRSGFVIEEKRVGVDPVYCMNSTRRNEIGALIID